MLTVSIYRNGMGKAHSYGMSETGDKRMTLTLILLIAHHLNFRWKVFKNSYCIVSTTVVDHNHMTAIPLDVFYHTPDGLGVVIRRDDYTQAPVLQSGIHQLTVLYSSDILTS